VNYFSKAKWIPARERVVGFQFATGTQIDDTVSHLTIVIRNLDNIL